MTQANINNIKEGSIVQTAMGVRWTIVKLGSHTTSSTDAQKSYGRMAIRRGNLIIDLSGIVDAHGDLMGFIILLDELKE